MISDPAEQKAAIENFKRESSRDAMLGKSKEYARAQKLKDDAEKLKNFNIQDRSELASQIGSDVATNVIGYSSPAHSLVPQSPPPSKLPPVKPTAGMNALTTVGKIGRSMGPQVLVGEPVTALMQGRYEKGQGNPDVGIFGDGYDFQKHGMFLEFPGIDVGRIPYYFNRSMYDLGSGISNMISPPGNPEEPKSRGRTG